MPQTRFVLKAALENGVKPIVIVNKIDREERRPEQVVELIQDLFLDLAIEDHQLDFPIVYASAREGYAGKNWQAPDSALSAVFRTIVEEVPPPSFDDTGGFQLLVAALDYDNYVGQISIGRITRGSVEVKQEISLLQDGQVRNGNKVEKLLVFEGLSRTETDQAQAGDIIALAGLDNVHIGDTVCSPDKLEALPSIKFEEPTVKMTFGVNTSPFMGKEGTNCTSRTLHERLDRELKTNLS